MSTNRQHDRFKGALWYNKVQGSIATILGAGGIGSWLSLYLYGSGCEIYLYDNDSFEEHNASGQLFFVEDMDKKKVLAVENMCKKIRTSDHSFYSLPEKFESTSMTSKFMFVGTDNFESRKIAFNRWKEVYGTDPEAVFIDGRLSFTKIEVYTVRGGTPEVEGYINTIFDDADFPEAQCTTKQNAPMAAKVGTFMWDKFTNHMTNLTAGIEVADIAFYFEYETASGRGVRCQTYQNYAERFPRPTLQDSSNGAD